MEPYYYQSMSKIEKNAYHELLEGLQRQDNSILVPAMNPAALDDLLFRLRLDHPEIFWVIGFRYGTNPFSDNMQVYPEYSMDKSKIKEHKRGLEARIEKIIRPWKDKSPEEQELLLHDFICCNVRYDKLKKPYSHEIIGPLGQGVGVCEGIAKSVKALCDALGIWCVVALCDNNPEKGIKYRHTWNVVRIKGQYYHLDVTFDASLSQMGKIRYDYFNLDDKKIFRDHEPLLHVMPACIDGDGFYYKQNKLSFTKEEQVRKHSLQAAQKGKQLTFHWRGGYLTREVLENLIAIIHSAGKEKGKIVEIGINAQQSVISLTYVKEGSVQVKMEDVNSNERV